MLQGIIFIKRVKLKDSSSFIYKTFIVSLLYLFLYFFIKIQQTTPSVLPPLTLSGKQNVISVDFISRLRRSPKFKSRAILFFVSHFDKKRQILETTT